jgi:hypothetical protein
LGGGEGVEADGMGDLLGAAGIGGEDDGELTVACGGFCEGEPALDAVYNLFNTGCVGAVCEAGILQIGVAFSRRFEADDTGEEATVDLGEDDVHGEVGGGEAALGAGPVAAAGGGEGDLEDRAAGGVQGGGSLGAAGGEGGGVDYGLGG